MCVWVAVGVLAGSVGLTFKAAGAAATGGSPNTSISHHMGVEEEEEEESGVEVGRGEGGGGLKSSPPLHPPLTTFSAPARSFSQVQQ